MTKAFNEAAKHVVGRARPKVPVRTAALYRSIRPASTQRVGRVSMGTLARGGGVPYAGWIEFGGTITGPKATNTRPFVKQGRYLFPSAEQERKPVMDTLGREVERLIKKAGLG